MCEDMRAFLQDDMNFVRQHQIDERSESVLGGHHALGLGSLCDRLVRLNQDKHAVRKTASIRKM